MPRGYRAKPSLFDYFERLLPAGSHTNDFRAGFEPGCRRKAPRPKMFPAQIWLAEG